MPADEMPPEIIKRWTYADMDLFLDGVDYFIDASPLVLVLGAALDHTEALKDVDDVVDTSALNS